jgi:hypothetical protein
MRAKGSLASSFETLASLVPQDEGGTPHHDARRLEACGRAPPRPSRRALTRPPQDEAGNHRARGSREPPRTRNSRCQTAHLVPAARFCARVLHLGFVPTGSKGGRSADRRLFVIVVAPASASVGRAGDARVASCEAAPDALAFRRSTVAVARHVPLRLRIISGNALNERDANLVLRTRIVVK